MKNKREKVKTENENQFKEDKCNYIFEKDTFLKKKTETKKQLFVEYKIKDQLRINPQKTRLVRKLLSNSRHVSVLAEAYEARFRCE